jgi:hypothetical protein
MRKREGKRLRIRREKVGKTTTANITKRRKMAANKKQRRKTTAD